MFRSCFLQTRLSVETVVQRSKIKLTDNVRVKGFLSADGLICGKPPCFCGTASRRNDPCQDTIPTCCDSHVCRRDIFYLQIACICSPHSIFGLLLNFRNGRATCFCISITMYTYILLSDTNVWWVCNDLGKLPCKLTSLSAS